MTLDEQILHEQRETNRLLRQLSSTLGTMNAEELESSEACKLLCVKNTRLLSKMRAKGWFGKNGFFKRGKNYFYKKSACQKIKEKLDSMEYSLKDLA